MDYSRDPPEQREEKAQDEAEDSAGHQDRHGRQSHTEKIAERFQIRETNQRFPSVRIAASVFSKARPGSVSPVLRSSSCVCTRFFVWSVSVWVVVVVVLAQPPNNAPLKVNTTQKYRVLIPFLTPDLDDEQRPAEIPPIRIAPLIRFLLTMKKNLIALTFLGLVAIFLGGCTSTTETTTTRTREQSSMYAR